MATPSFSFKAEYAKSARSSCNQCGDTIEKEELRLAQMVQATNFDGKIPKWYHVKCFFICRNFTIPETSEVGNFDSLRWDDQQMLKEKCAAGPCYELTTEYARSGRSTCRGCGEKIDNGVLRVGVKEPDDDFGYDYKSLLWYHPDCLKGSLPHLNIKSIKAEDFDGYKSLRSADKKKLREALGEAEETDMTGAGKGKGKKRKGQAEGRPTDKKQKQENAEEMALKSQAEVIWKIKDSLNNDLNNALLKEMLLANKQSAPSNTSKMVEQCTDGIAFGALQPCSACSGGQLIFTGNQYACTGNLTSWTKCTFSTREPSRVKWIIPDETKEASAFLKTFKPQVKQRVYGQKQLTKDTTDYGLLSNAKHSCCCHGYKHPGTGGFQDIDKLSKSKPALTKIIQSLGGQVINDVNSSTTLCVSSKAELDKMTKKMKEVQQSNICVVSEDYLDDVQHGGGLVKIMAHKISLWGDIKLPKSGQQLSSTSTAKPTAASSNPDPFCNMKKLAVKGGAVVDPDSGLSKTHRVYENGGVIYNAVLGLVDIVQGTNSFYKLQLLEADSSKKFVLYRAWGRVGTAIGGNKREDHGKSAKKAIAQFESLYAEKTGNQWGTPADQFVKYPKKFYPLEIDYGQDEEDFGRMMVSAGATSKLDPAIQSLVKMIFDVDSMKQTLLEFEIDVNKMPLGKLSKKQIESAYKVLTEALTEIQGDKNSTKLLDASNRFYTLIPHDFGFQSPPLLDHEEIIKSKTQMVDNLLEIEITYSLLKEQIKSDITDQRDPLDINYEKLKTDIEVLAKDSEEFKMLEEYVVNTHAPTHSSYSLELMDVFKIERHGEGKRYKPFKKLPNRKLLWHGSRTTNYAGILSQGLRIAPPVAPVTGYMFGKGVYFAGIWCLRYQLKHSEFVVKPPEGKLSTKGLGQTHPDPSKDIILPDGVVVPKGKGVDSKITNSSLLYNEYIVYDVAQINMKYLLKTKFNYKKSAWGW